MIDEVSGRGRAVAPRLPRVDTEAFAGPLAAAVSVDVILTVGADYDQARLAPIRKTRRGAPAARAVPIRPPANRPNGRRRVGQKDQGCSTGRSIRNVPHPDDTDLCRPFYRHRSTGRPRPVSGGAKSPAGVFPGVRPPAAVKGLLACRGDAGSAPETVRGDTTSSRKRSTELVAAVADAEQHASGTQPPRRRLAAACDSVGSQQRSEVTRVEVPIPKRPRSAAGCPSGEARCSR